MDLRSAFLASFLSAAGALIIPGVARADDAEPPRPRQGYYVALGGAGLLSVSREKGDTGGAVLGGGGGLRLGELLTPSLGIGIALEGGSGSGTDKSTVGGLSFDVHYLVRGLVAVHAGIGLGVSSLQDVNDPKADSRGGLGTSYTLGLSYDGFLTSADRSGGWSLSPLFQVRLVDTRKVQTGLVFAGLQVTYWSGLDRARLVLDDKSAYEGK